MPQEHYLRIERGGNQAAIVFVHGLFGNYRQTWEDFPFLVTQDTELNHCDIICWGYPSELRGAPFLHVPFLGHRPPHLSSVADKLDSELRNPQIGGSYSDLVLVGHSMGGLVIERMILSAILNPSAEKASLLDSIRHVTLYATPSEGVQLPAIAKVHAQMKDIACDEKFINDLREGWKVHVGTAPNDPGGPGKRYIPVTAVVGLEDNAVTEQSAKSVYADVETAPGNHMEVCKPDNRNHTSFQVLKRVVLQCTMSRLVSGAGAVMAANIQIVKRAAKELFMTGSRSRDEKYLRAIEEKLKECPGLIHHRVLIGPPRNSVLKDHLLRLLEIRSPSDTSLGYRTLHIGIFDEEELQPEIFLCGNERTVLAVLPPMTGIGEFTTATLFTDPRHAERYLLLTKQLYAKSTKLDTVASVQALPVRQVPSHAS